jgi:RNA polymerase sigma-70 factor (ECF subfamily)
VTPTPKTSISLILKVANEQDVTAWQRFCEIYQPLVYRIAISRGLQSADAHDLVQEVMARVARSISRWDPDANKGSFRGWISRIARNLIVDFFRRKNRLPVTSDHSDIRKFVETTPAGTDDGAWFDLEYEKQVFINAATQIKSKFNENTWQAFWLTSVENQAVESVAKQLSMTPGSIYVARSRVMAKLKETVKFLIEGEE